MHLCCTLQARSRSRHHDLTINANKEECFLRRAHRRSPSFVGKIPLVGILGCTLALWGSPEHAMPREQLCAG